MTRGRPPVSTHPYGNRPCEDCEDPIPLTDVEGHYSGRCKKCRDDYELQLFESEGYGDGTPRSGWHGDDARGVRA